MADFWIKIEKGTPDKPELLEMASILNIDDPDTVMGKLVRVWSWFDSNSENGHAPSVTNVLIDRMTGVTGFTDALVAVGWMQKIDGGYYMSNFERHIGKGAKKRASDAERKRKSRECHAQTVTDDVTETGLDKSRVDKSIDKDIPPISPKGEKVEWEDDYIKSFWSAYPKKEGRKTAIARLRKMIRKKPDKDFMQMILERVRQKALVTERQYWPSADRYLREEKWEDEIIDYNTGYGNGKSNNIGHNQQRECFADEQKRHAQMLMARLSQSENRETGDVTVYENGSYVQGQVPTTGPGDS